MHTPRSVGSPGVQPMASGKGQEAEGFEWSFQHLYQQGAGSGTENKEPKVLKIQPQTWNLSNVTATQHLCILWIG